MEFKQIEFQKPDFSKEEYVKMRDITVAEVEKDGVAPDDFYLTSHMPTFYKYKGQWILPEHNSLNCVAVLENEDIIKQLFPID